MESFFVTSYLLLLQTNFNAEDYAGEAIPRLSGKTREEVKTTLKSERIKVCRNTSTQARFTAHLLAPLFRVGFFTRLAFCRSIFKAPLRSLAGIIRNVLQQLGL
jgi:hypothetical protein